MKNNILNELDAIDPIYIDEHLEWGKRKKTTYIMIYRAISVAACLVFIVTSVLG